MSAYIVVLEIARGLAGPQYTLNVRDPLAPGVLVPIAPHCVGPGEMKHEIERLKKSLDRALERMEADFKKNKLRTDPERILRDCDT